MPPAAREVLLADDNADFAEVLAELLTDDGFNVRVARDGREAVDMFRAARADVLLLDLAMPRRDGLSALEEIRLTSPDVPAIFLTAYESEALRLRMREPARDADLGVMMKPVHYPELAARLARLPA